MSSGKGMSVRTPATGRRQVTIRAYTGSPSPVSSPQDLRPDQDEATGFLEDIEAAAVAASPEPEGGPPASAGSSSRRPWKCGDLWWLLAVPALVLMLLFAREWAAGGSGGTLTISRAAFKLGRERATVPTVHVPDTSGGSNGSGQPAPDPAGGELDAAEAAALEAARQAGRDAGSEQPPAAAEDTPAAGSEDAEAAGDERAVRDAAGSGDAEPDAADGDSSAEEGGAVPDIENPADRAEAEPGASGGGGGDATGEEADSEPPAIGEADADSSGSGAAGGDSGDEQLAAAGEAEADGSGGGDAASWDGTNAEAAAGAEQPDAAGGTDASGKAAKEPEATSGRRSSKARIVVMPTQWCQGMTPKADAECMANGASTPKCKKAFKGTYMHSYLSPFLRIAPYMKLFGLPGYAVNSEIGPHRWRKPHDGSDWDLEMKAADVIIMEEHDARKILRAYPNKTLVLLQTNAAAAMLTCPAGDSCSHNLLLKPNVARFLQHTALRPLQLNNARRYESMPHYDLMRQVHIEKTPEAEHNWGPAPGKPAFTAAMLAKVQTLSPMFWRWRYPMTCHGQSEYVTLMAPALDPPSEAPPAFLPAMDARPIDVAFSGSVAPPEWRQTPEQRIQNELYAAHRGALLAELEAIRERNPQLRIEIAAHISYPEFVTLLRSTKMFISPLGHGEYSGKDYEAVIQRALLVKPLARHLASYPNIYEVNATCVDVAMDFSDLESTLQGLMADQQRMQTLADAAWGRLAQYSDPRVVAADVADMLHDVIGEAGL